MCRAPSPFYLCQELKSSDDSRFTWTMAPEPGPVTLPRTPLLLPNPTIQVPVCTLLRRASRRFDGFQMGVTEVQWPAHPAGDQPAAPLCTFTFLCLAEFGYFFGVALTALGWLWWHIWGPGTPRLFCVAGLALGDICLRFVWQAWHSVTSAFALCGRRGTCGTGLALVAHLGAWDAACTKDAWMLIFALENFSCLVAGGHGNFSIPSNGSCGKAQQDHMLRTETEPELPKGTGFNDDSASKQRASDRPLNNHHSPIWPSL
eukprot:s549_g17.t1